MSSVPVRRKRRRPESNWCTRLCRPLPNHSATAPAATIVAPRMVRQFGPMHALRGRAGHLVGCDWFWAWALVGLAVAIALVSLGVLALAPAALVALLSSDRARWSVFGLVTGAGFLALLVAWPTPRPGHLLLDEQNVLRLRPVPEPVAVAHDRSRAGRHGDRRAHAARRLNHASAGIPRPWLAS